MQSIATSRERGFTLIEMLIIAPLVILLIGSFVVFIVSLTGGGLRSRDQNVMAYDVQNALNTIEDDATFATAFVSQTATTQFTEGFASYQYFPIATPQGSNDDATNYTTSANGPLLIAAAATTTTPLSTSKQLVYLNTPDSSCSAGTLVTNNPYEVLYVYFVRDGSLWRRVIMGNTSVYSLCNGPAWQKASCSTDDISSYPSVCGAEDSKLLENISTFSVSYYNSASGTSPVSAYTWAKDDSPKAINVTITASKTIAGQSVSFSGSLRVASVNIR